MKIIVVGCGRLGSGLADTLCREGHAVSVIDPDQGALDGLPASCAAGKIHGSVLDRANLLAAEIESADALAAVTASDEVNIVAARLARRMFHVPRAVARLYDPRKADACRRLGLLTISQVTWGVARIRELLCYSKLEPMQSLGSGEVDLVEVEVPHLLVGRTVRDLTLTGEIHAVAITRRGRTFLPTLSSELHQGDLVHLALLSASSERLKLLLELP